MAITFGKGGPPKVILPVIQPGVEYSMGGRGSAKSENLNAMIEAEALRMVERNERKQRKMDRAAQAVEMDDIATGRMLVSLRLDPSVVAFFKALGPGWTGKINDVLVKLVKEGADRWLSK